MPIIDVTLIEGRPPHVLREFADTITRAAHELLEAPVESVRVIVRQVPPGMFFVGGKDRSVVEHPAPRLGSS
ncbi:MULTISPECIES: tautomerase family protein [unclassified Mycolicibacterium]|uniref:tautomerase family protein n=1 Tax=unclassified Mycolicibacterium TaxID=2636767 RepID=UPI001F4C45A6|nr:tautomerase family protein [Mycolicibacterium sp. YH-1]UNB55602.1 tautomerase family protein [Mycolicibacterium sp. YH-1]